MLENQKNRARDRRLLFDEVSDPDDYELSSENGVSSRQRADVPPFASRTMPFSNGRDTRRGGSRSERSVLVAPDRSDGIFVRGRRTQSAAAGTTHLGRCSPRRRVSRLHKTKRISPSRRVSKYSGTDVKETRETTAATQIQNWLRARIRVGDAAQRQQYPWSSRRSDVEADRDFDSESDRNDPLHEDGSEGDVREQRCEVVMRGHRAAVTCMQFGDWLRGFDVVASGSLDATARLWDPTSGKQIRVLHHVSKGSDEHDGAKRSGLTALRVCSRTSALIAGVEDGSVWTWDIETGKRKRKVNAHEKEVRCICGVEDGTIRTSRENDGSEANRIVTAGDKVMHIWDFRSRRPLVATLRGHTDLVTAVAIHASSSTVLSGSRDQCVRAWDIRMGRSKFVGREHIGTIRCLQATHGRDVQFISAGRDSSLKVWDCSGKCLRTMRGHRGSVNSTAFAGTESSTHHSNRIVSGSSDANIRLWNVDEGRCLKVLRGHQSPVTVVSWPGGPTVVSGSKSGVLKVWNLNDGKCFRTLRGHAEGGSITNLHCDARRILSASKDGTLRLWGRS